MKLKSIMDYLLPDRVKTDEGRDGKGISKGASKECKAAPENTGDMSNRIKISVIIPVYNMENYIGLCIESLRQQLLDGLEFIFVDDCSTDGTMDKVEAWASQDDRVRILRNDENIGPGPSRNRGIDAARGDYLSFIDSDDYISPDFYELLYSSAVADGGHDIVKGSRCKVDAATNNKIPNKIELNNRIIEQQSKGIPLFHSFTYEHQTALYRAGLFKDGRVRYGQQKNAEDTTFLLGASLVAKDIVFCPKAMYYYVQREGSLVHTYTPRRFFSELDSLEEQVAILKERGIDADACRYLAKKVKTFTGVYEKAVKENHELEEIRVAYYQRIDSILSSAESADKNRKLANLKIP